MASPRRKRKFTVYFDPEQDAALLAWLSTQTNGSEAIRRVLQSHLAEQSQSTESHGLDLSDIRSVVEAAVRNILGQFQVGELSTKGGDELADETQTLLDDLADSLTLE